MIEFLFGDADKEGVGGGFEAESLGVFFDDG